MDAEEIKLGFRHKIKQFAESLSDVITLDNEWTVKGFIDAYKNIFTISSDTKIISKILEIHILPQFYKFSNDNNFTIELASRQNWYPDFTLVDKNNENTKFAVDLKTTYRNDKNPNFCNGFTLGSHGEYFKNRLSNKNIQYPYSQYIAHYCLGIIYSRNVNDDEQFNVYKLEELASIKSVIKDFTFFAEEKWRIASDKSGSGNTANIGSITNIDDIINGNGIFAKAGEQLFDEYWTNYGLITSYEAGKPKKITSFQDYLKYRNLSAELLNTTIKKRAMQNES